MCTAAIAIGATVLSTVVGAVGQIQQGKAAASSAKYQAAVDRNNAIIADRNAVDARKRGAAAEEAQRTKTQLLLGRQRAVMGANNLDLSSGSPLDILGDTAKVGEIDALTVRSNADREAAGYLAQKMNFTADAGLADMRAKSARSAATIGAFGTVLGGLGSVADRWYKMA